MSLRILGWFAPRCGCGRRSARIGDQSRTHIPRYFSSSNHRKRNVAHDQQLRETSQELKGQEIGQENVRGVRRNSVNIQMISEKIHEQLFDSNGREVLRCDDKLLRNIEKHFKEQSLFENMKNISNENTEEVNFGLPPLEGKNIEEHFLSIALKQVEEYKLCAETLTASPLPPIPKHWSSEPGWTCYLPDGSTSKVDFPPDGAVVFDVEVLMQEGCYPTMATAASPSAWYSWSSSRIFQNPKKDEGSGRITIDELIPMETPQASCQPPAVPQPRLVVGHNVGFDRSFIKEQYLIQGTELRFLDTMSMHIAVSGLTSFQRILYVASKKGSRRKEVREMEENALRLGLGEMSTEWTQVSSLNNLNDVYQLYNQGAAPLQKATRDVFVKGSMSEVRGQFQELMTYCANDVLATHKVFTKLWEDFKQRFRHPVTLCGMLEMGTAYLPINSNWERYISQADDTFNDLQRKLKLLLMNKANDACQLLRDDRYLDDPWLWDLDWTVKKPRTKSVKPTKVTKQAQSGETADATPKVEPHNTGNPVWYTALCPRPKEQEEYGPGPSKVTLQQRIAPKLLRLMWDGFPLHYDKEHGWGYLVPGREISESEQLVIEDNKENKQPTFPLQSALRVCKPALQKCVPQEAEVSDDDQYLFFDQLDRVGLTDDESKKLWMSIYSTKQRKVIKKASPKLKGTLADGPHWHTGIGPFDIGIAGCWFYKLPHKDGPDKRVGNPLSKDFIHKLEDGTLSSAFGDEVKELAKLQKMCSYWKNNQDRVSQQMAISLKPEQLPKIITRHKDYAEEKDYGCILPRIVTAGTVTRRAVESTWMTASNAYVDRVGSELKSMVQCPPGYSFVGADVDSQELWIAAILGDANFAHIHGCTAFSWMTLQGNKQDGTDLHSKTAQILDINRDQAKVFNYGRIYGAGRVFAERLLQQFNHKLTKQNINAKVTAMFSQTKGKRERRTYYEEDEEYRPQPWRGGSESHMFNKLENIAMSSQPQTPVLGGLISKALQPEYVNTNFMTSRVNWVIQSSAVDYLHLMLSCMKWLCHTYDINARFCISIHDEVRYLVAEEDRYRAALALQITNLLTRSMFASRLNMKDLPQSVAFFSCVDIDSCLRKEVTLDCRTPSNPEGLHKGYAIPPGEALSMRDILDKTGRSLSRTQETHGSTFHGDFDEIATEYIL